jgi:hypothetical protein
LKGIFKDYICIDLIGQMLKLWCKFLSALCEIISTENVTKSTENVNHNSIDLDRHLVPRDSPPVVNCKNNRNISMKPQLNIVPVINFC